MQSYVLNHYITLLYIFTSTLLGKQFGGGIGKMVEENSHPFSNLNALAAMRTVKFCSKKILQPLTMVAS